MAEKNSLSVRIVVPLILAAVLLPISSAFAEDNTLTQTLFSPETFTRASGTT